MSSRVMRTFLLFLVSGFLVVSCQAQPQKPASPTLTAQPVVHEAWWRKSVFYEVFVRSFYDSNADGKGDIEGLIQKLDYLNDGNPNTTTDLGVTGIWLMPVFPSPSYHGFDVSDYRSINPDYGTLDDFRRLLVEAHKRGIRVVIDLVINHTSSQNPWFLAAKNADPKYRDWYIWSTKDPGYLGPWGEKVWYPSGNQFYYAVFDPGMPDLNYRNPAVTQAVDDIASFWLKDIGVDGFRMDGAKHIIEDGKTQENTPETHAWLKQFNGFTKKIAPDSLMVGEVWSPSAQVASYIGDQDLDLAFNFDLASEFINGVNMRDGPRITTAIETQKKLFRSWNFATFLTNHDMNRVMNAFLGNVDKARAAATILLTSPGVPFIYYGEELGMLGSKPDEKIRSPMQWNGDDRAGFSTGTPWENPNSGYLKLNVAVESGASASLLNHYRQLIHLRSQNPALSAGDYWPVSSNPSQVYAALRSQGDTAVLVLVNLSKQELTGVKISWQASPLMGPYHPQVLLGEGSVNSIQVGDGGGLGETEIMPVLPANATMIVQWVH